MSSSVRKSMIEQYKVRSEGQYATICVSCWGPTEADPDSYYGGEILINSSYGRFCHQWHACGEPFKQFLVGLNFDYFMNKCLKGDAQVYDGKSTFKKAVTRVLTARRHGELVDSDARFIYDALQQDAFEILESEDLFYTCLDFPGTAARTIGLFDDAHEMVSQMPNPQATGFWNKLWPLFVTELQAEMTEALVQAAPLVKSAAVALHSM
jgi:hypothetical protein